VPLKRKKKRKKSSRVDGDAGVDAANTASKKAAIEGAGSLRSPAPEQRASAGVDRGRSRSASADRRSDSPHPAGLRVKFGPDVEHPGAAKASGAGKGKGKGKDKGGTKGKKGSKSKGKAAKGDGKRGSALRPPRISPGDAEQVLSGG